MKIICFGDSLTRGISVVKGRLRILKDNYPAFLQEWFQQNKKDNIEVVNKGIFNADSDLLLTRLNKDVIDEKPDYAIIEIGGNDCNFRWNEVAERPYEDHKPIVPLDRYLNNIKEIVTKIRKAGITPLIMNLPPLDPVRYYKSISDVYGTSISHFICSVGGIEYWHENYHRMLNKLIDQLNVIKIDTRHVISPEQDLSEMIGHDGIHLTSTGYRALGTEAFKPLSVLLDNH
ncbi:MAG: SGNH/GDSL hydrolase family protein [Tuberibacillus sp.]